MNWSVGIADAVKNSRTRSKMQGRLVRELESYKEMLVQQGSCSQHELVHLDLLQQQVQRGEKAPALAADGATPAVRLDAARDLAAWMRRQNPTAFPRQADVAVYLNARGQRTARGRSWTQASVSMLLRGLS
jgi:hypothetical protein